MLQSVIGGNRHSEVHLLTLVDITRSSASKHAWHQGTLKVKKTANLCKGGGGVEESGQQAISRCFDETQRYAGLSGWKSDSPRS